MIKVLLSIIALVVVFFLIDIWNLSLLDWLFWISLFVISGLFWIKMRKKGHKDLIEIIHEKLVKLVKRKNR